MKLDVTSTSVPSWMGVICSLLLIVIILGYSAQKIEILIKRRDVDIVSALHDSYFYTHEQPFTAEQGFNVAVALSYIDLPLDPALAKMVFFRSEWGYNEDEEFIYKRTELESHVCSEEELGLSGDKPRFMPIHKS